MTGSEREPRRITAADVRASFNPAAANQPIFIAYLVRPLSFLFTAPFYNSGWSANGVTYLKILIGVLALLGLGSGKTVAYIGVAIAIFVHHILDCVDGNLARLTDTATYWGKFVDGLSDGLLMSFVPLAVGTGVWVQSGNATFLLIGASVSALTLSTHLTRNRLSFFRDWMVSEIGSLPDEVLTKIRTARRIERTAIVISGNARFLAPLSLLLPNGGLYYLILLAVIHGAFDGAALVANIHEAHVMLSRHRRSRHAALADRGTA